MADLVATMVVGPLLSAVKEKASSYLLDQYKVMEGMENQREILMRKLLAILDVIIDAEEAAAHRAGAKAWLEAIKKVAYEANEIFDEFKYEALRRQAKKNGHYTDLDFHVIKLFPTHNRFVFRVTMGNKLRRILQTNHVIFDPHKIISTSRGEDSKNIVDILLAQASNEVLTVVPIVGIGGLGKTTFAQLVFNDPEIQKHFELLLWVCVSDNFDVNSLANTIVQALPKKKRDHTDANFKKSTLDSLKNALSGQRYLLVLDDVWNREDDKWEKLKASLQYGGKGSAVLTTTRDRGVAEIMGTVKAYNLAGLKDKFIKEIIESRAFSLQKKEERPVVLVKMVDEIVKRCVGSPLAATALGSVLRTKKSEEEWKAVSSRSNICTEESGILPILKLSYNDLPSHMKQCFAFCAVFPKDYEIDVDKLIQLWIANGFIEEQGGVRLETIGKHIFNELASRSFFQDMKRVQVPISVVNRMGGCYSRQTCKIHDLMHDVAQSIMEKECAVADGKSTDTKWLTNTARHLFLSCSSPQLLLNTSLNETSPAIQTLVCDSTMSGSLQHLAKYSSLRALQLCTSRRVNTFPLKPIHLHHLRYLDLSKSSIKALPEDISILYNLQTLNLSDCYRLDRLPRQMKYMTALRHLYTHGCPELKSMPPGLSKLASLQTLTCFVAGTGPGCSNLSELQDLDLGGELELCQLENVTEEDAKAANFAEKKELRELTLKWTPDREQDVEVLNALEPHVGQLQAVRIDSYGGSTFPTWMDLLPKMTEIHLFRCKKVQYLFNRDTPFKFPNLKELTLEDLPDFERLCETADSGGPGEEIIFPNLEKLFIIKCRKLTALPGQPAFPNLQNACIKECPLLKTKFEAPKLGVLDIGGGEEEMFLWVASHMTSLTNLKLELSILVDELSVPKHILVDHHKFPLAAMKLSRFLVWKSVSELCSCFLQLQDLEICESDALVHWPEKEFQNLVSLRTLQISSCKKLTGFEQAAPPPEPSTTTSFGRSQLLPNLEALYIRFCDSLVEMFNVPASLRELAVIDCSKVESIFGRRQQQQGMSSDAITEQHFLLPCLEYLRIQFCPSFTGDVLHLPPSLETLWMDGCNELRSLESSSGELSLQVLFLEDCKMLSSLPEGPQAYSSLRDLEIRKCPGIKTLPACLQQRLGSLEYRYLDVRYEGPKLLSPKTWKYAL